MGWIGTALIVLGRYRLGGRHSDAFIFSGLGDLCWLSVGYTANHYDMIALSGVLLSLNAVNYYRWTRACMDSRRLQRRPTPEG